MTNHTSFKKFIYNTKSYNSGSYYRIFIFFHFLFFKISFKIKIRQITNTIIQLLEKLDDIVETTIFRIGKVDGACF